MSGNTEIVANIKKCASVRQCVTVAPDYFGPNGEGGRVRVLRSTVPPKDFDLVDEAVESCPMQVLSLHPNPRDSASGTTDKENTSRSAELQRELE